MSHPDDPGPRELPEDLLALAQQSRDPDEGGRTLDAELAALNVASLAAQQAQEHPSPDLFLRLEAQRCEEQADWEGAQIAYQKELGRAIGAGDLADLFRAHDELSRLFHLLGDDNSALEHARRGASAAREADSAALLAMALEGHARCALRLRNHAEAATALAEALAALAADPTYDLQRGRCLVLRARYRVAGGDYPAAEQDLQEAWRLLEPPSATPIAAGAHSGLAAWWSVTAELRAARGDARGAEEARAQAVERMRHVAALPQVTGPYTRAGLAETLQDYGRALLANGRQREADEILAESRGIRKALGLPVRA
jgi:tetratricopeptide (TPR) repeat protein